MNPKILFVDDEVNVLNALRRDMVMADIDAEYFISAKAALEYLSQHPVGIVVSDLNMPEMDGITFLEEVQREYPDTYRVILSGADEKNKQLKEALLNRTVEQFFAKPWNIDELLAYFERFKSYVKYSII
jgi:DNA-binding NtrC family response regulator